MNYKLSNFLVCTEVSNISDIILTVKDNINGNEVFRRNVSDDVKFPGEMKIVMNLLVYL